MHYLKRTTLEKGQNEQTGGERLLRNILYNLLQPSFTRDNPGNLQGVTKLWGYTFSIEFCHSRWTTFLSNTALSTQGKKQCSSSSNVASMK